MSSRDTSTERDYAQYPKPRARQACENCRRKKARCPGQKPRCSLCERLKQRCIYTKRVPRGGRAAEKASIAPSNANGVERSSAVDASENELRIRELEKKIQDLTNARGPRLENANGEQNSLPGSPWPVAIQGAGSLHIHSRYGHSLHQLLSQEIIAEGIPLYYRYFCNQPYPILNSLKTQALAGSAQIPDIVLYPMLALSLRTSRHSRFQDRKALVEVLENLANAAWDLLADNYRQFDLPNGFFEGACLLAQVDFAVGRTDRALAQIAMSLGIAQVRGMLCSNGSNEEDTTAATSRHEVVWTLFLMDRILRGAKAPSPFLPVRAYALSVFQGGPLSPEPPSRSRQEYTLCESKEGRRSIEPRSIVALIIELITIWEEVIRDIFPGEKWSDIPMWRPGSARAEILSQLLEFEPKLKCHWYATTGSSLRAIREPHLREYFRSWLFFEILHSTIYCCLNHPFVIFMKTRKTRRRVPRTFLQKSYEDSMIYSNWVVTHISDMTEANLELYDPFVGHLVAISASIQLEHTLSKNPIVAESCQRKFDRCRDYIRRVSKIWPSMLNTLNTLDDLAQRIGNRQTINYVEKEYDGIIPSEAVEDVAIDAENIELLWKLFDFMSMSSQPKLDWVDASPLSIHGSHQRPSHNTAEPHWELNTDPDSATLGPMCDPARTGQSLEEQGLDFSRAVGDEWLFLGKPWSMYFPQEDSWDGLLDAEPGHFA